MVIASVLELILDKTGAMGNLRVLRAFQPLKVVTASRSLREVRLAFESWLGSCFRLII